MISVLMAGDYVIQNRVAQLFDNDNFDYVFKDVKAILNDIDYSIVNLESPVVETDAKPILKTGPNLKCSKKAVDALKYAGFDCVTLANNHFYDYGEQGVHDTLIACREANIDSVGGGINRESASEILYKQIKGKTVALINICEHEWSIATETRGGAAPLDPISNFYKIKEASQIADYVITIVHGGTEHYNLPTPRMKKTYRYFVDSGADIVVNHHQHCYSGYEEYNGKYIFYGLGNFCFDNDKQERTFWNDGYMLKLILADKITFEIIPYLQCAESPTINFNVHSDAFFESLKELNEIISDDNLLESCFNDMVHKRTDGLLLALEPYNNRYIKYLRYRKFLPSLLSKQWYRLLLALFRCESHRDILLDILMKKNNQ